MGSEKSDRLSDRPSQVLRLLSLILPVFPMLLVTSILSHVDLEPNL